MIVVNPAQFFWTLRGKYLLPILTQQYYTRSSRSDNNCFAVILVDALLTDEMSRRNSPVRRLRKAAVGASIKDGPQCTLSCRAGHTNRLRWRPYLSKESDTCIHTANISTTNSIKTPEREVKKFLHQKNKITMISEA